MLELIKQEDLKLWGWLDYSLRTLKRDKRERRNINLNVYFDNFQTSWSNVLKDRQINMCIINDENTVCNLKAFEIDLDSIFNNLLSNSINSFKEINKEGKEIKIIYNCFDDEIIIEFQDNGKGLDEKYKQDNNMIFNLFESSKVDKYGKQTGTGMGLYIVKSIINDYNGASISVDPSSAGLRFIITFKIRK